MSSAITLAPELLKLHAQSAALPVEQRAMLTHLLNPPALTNSPTNFDDTRAR